MLSINRKNLQNFTFFSSLSSSDESKKKFSKFLSISADLPANLLSILNFSLISQLAVPSATSAIFSLNFFYKFIFFSLSTKIFYIFFWCNFLDALVVFFDIFLADSLASCLDNQTIDNFLQFPVKFSQFFIKKFSNLFHKKKVFLGPVRLSESFFVFFFIWYFVVFTIVRRVSTLDLWLVRISNI